MQTFSLSEQSILNGDVNNISVLAPYHDKRWIEHTWWSDVGSQHWIANGSPMVTDAIAAAAVESMK